MRILLCLVAVALHAAVDAGGGYAGGPISQGVVGGPSLVGQPQFAGVAGGGGFAGAPCAGAACGGGGDFNPALLRGNRGYPGIRARVNQRAFQYASGMIGDLLNSEIKKARLPPISQCVPQVNGCIQIYNLYVSRYRCPQRVVIYPAPPNRIVLQVQNLDIGVTGNLGGQITILLPLALFGIVQLNLHQVSITTDLAIERSATGAPSIRVMGCTVTIGYADAYIEQGGLIGDIVNSQFRSRVSSMVKDMVPGKICAQLPSIVNEKLNGKIGGLPQTIALTQMASMFGGALGLGAPSQQFCQQSCSAGASAGVASTGSAAIVSPPVSAGAAPQIPSDAYSVKVARAVPMYQPAQVPVYQTGAQQYYYQQRRVAREAGFSPNVTSDSAFTVIQRAAIIKSFDEALDYVGAPKVDELHLEPLNDVEHRRAKRGAQLRPAPPAVYRSVAAPVFRQPRGAGHVAGGVASAGVVSGSSSMRGLRPGSGAVVPPPPPVPGAPPPALVPPPADGCAKCPAAAGGDDPASLIKQMAAHLDLNKLNDMYLNIQLMNTYATNNDFTIDLVGEFSPYGQGGTPFGPFPVQFPAPYDNHMAELIITDYTINSLFYHMHRKGFLSFRIGPDTPKIGELLKTTCNDDEDDELEDHGVELDEEDDEERRKLKRSYAVHDQLHHIAAHSVAKRAHTHSKRHNGKRGRRQDDDDGGGFADLGICFGDILPAVREKYPNQKISILIHSVRAPSVILSAAHGGMAIIDLMVDADIYIDGTNTKVGTISIISVVQVIVHVQGNRISGSAEITTLQLRDHAGTLGLQQDALDNLGNLGKELLQKLANDALGKGINVNMPTMSGLPFQIINPSFQIVEHGLYIATDLSVDINALGLGGGGC